MYQSNINTELYLFCPRASCSYYQSKGNTIRKDGVYRTKNDQSPRQMFYCVDGEHRFSETNYSDIFGKHGSFKEYIQIAKLSHYGLSTDAIADVLEKDQRTIETWQKGIAKKSNKFHIFICMTITLMVSFIQMDELWSFLGKKKKQLWVFIGIDVPTRFWINFELGSRTTYIATKLVEGISRLMGNFSPGVPLKITTDKLAAYRNAIENIFKSRNYVYLQIVKKRFRKILITVKKCFVKGEPKDFPGKTQNTSYIERINLTLRQRISFLRRKSLGFCKKKINFNNVLWINLFDYNYLRMHKSLRTPIDEQGKYDLFQKRWHHKTPAMAMGLTKKQLSWRFLLVAPIPATY